MSKHLVARTLVALSVSFNVLFAAGLWMHWRHSAPRPGIARIERVDNVRHGAVFLCHFRTPMPVRSEGRSAALLTFTPRLDHEVIWQDARTAVIVPRTAPPPGKDYLVQAATDTVDEAGRPLDRRHTAVSTPPLTLTSPIRADRLDGTLTRLVFPFNGPVDPATLATFVDVTDEANVHLTILRSETLAVNVPAVTVVHPDTCRQLTLILRPGLAAVGGEHAIAKALSLNIQLTQDLVVGDLSAYADSGRIAVSVALGGNVAAEELQKFLTIAPPVAVTAVSSAWSGFRIEGDFKPRTFYRLTFRKGLRTSDGRVLVEDAERHLVTGSLGTQLDFATSGPYLPTFRGASLPLNLCNIEKLHVELTRIYPNNLLAFFRDGESSAERNGPVVGRRDIDSGLPVDTPSRFDLPLAPLVGPNKAGIFLLSVSRISNGQEFDNYGSWWQRAERAIVLTDLALTAVEADAALEVCVRSFADNHPVADCEIEVFSYHNQSLGKGVTDTAGRARVALAASHDLESSANLVVARRGDDISALSLDTCQHDLSAFEYDGALCASTPYEAFVYTERGICRPGESIHVSALVRDSGLKAAGGFPVQLVVTDPEGNTFRERLLDVAADGFVSAEIAIPVSARTGAYSCALRTPGDRDGVAWGECSFRVGVALPDRIRVTVSLDKEVYTAGETAKGQVQADYYFGKAAARCRLECHVSYAAEDFEPEGFDDFRFGNAERTAKLPSYVPVAGAVVGETGGAEFSITPAADLEAPAAIGMHVVAVVSEDGGRAVAGDASATVHVYPYYLGLRQDWKPGKVPHGPVPFSWVAVAPDGKPAAPGGPLRYKLFREDWRYLLVLDPSTKAYRYEWKRDRQPAGEGTVTLAATQTEGRLEIPCAEPGEYFLLVTDASGRVQVSDMFWYWRGDGGGARPTHQAYLDISTDRDLYHPADTARLTFEAPAAGQALVCVGTDRLAASRTAAVTPGENTVEIPVPDTAFGSAFAAVTFIADSPRPGLFPRRLFGLVRLDIDQAAHRLDAALAAADVARPGDKLPLDITLTAGGRPAAGRVQILAVDEGILALTRYETPDPFAAFFGPRQCGLRFADVYDAVFPELEDTAGQKSAVGGDAIEDLLNPLAVEEVRSAVVVLPPVEIGSTGQAHVELDLPDHTGALRIMAVAWNADAVGSQAREVKLHRQVTVLLTAPRAVAPGDEFEVTAQVFNHGVASGAAGSVEVQASGTAAVAKPEDARFPLSLAVGEQKTFRVRCQADAKAAGTATLKARVQLGSEVDESTVRVSVRPPSPPVFESGFTAVAAGDRKDIRLERDWLANTGRLTFRASSSLGVEAAGALVWLRQYPYGCLEQTASAAFAWLQFPELAAAEGNLTDTTANAVDDDLDKAVQRLMLLELPGDGFGMWPDDRHMWMSGSIFAAHFLAEAHARGVPIDDAFWRRTVRFLQRVAQGGFPQDSNPADTAYATYVLARAGAPENGIAEGTLADDNALPFIRFLAAAALIHGGRASTGAAGLDRLATTDLLGGSLAWDMDSHTRRLALALNVLLDAQPESPQIPPLFEKLRKAQNREGHWGSTQTNALAAAALGKWAGLHRADKASRGILRGTPAGEVEVTAAKPLRYDGPLLASLAAEAAGPGPLYCSWTLTGVPLRPPAETESKGLELQRQYLNAEGHAAHSFAQGDLVRVKLIVHAREARGNVVIADILPGGLEIEDASLDTRWAPSDKVRRMTVRFIEKREDRFLLFCDLQGDAKEPAEFEYTARAVSRGRYTGTRVTAEAMYEPDIRAGLTDPSPIIVE